MNEPIKDILYVRNKLIIAPLSRTVWLMFSSFLIFYCYFTRLKAREVSWQNMTKSEIIGHIVLGTVQ